MIQRLIARALVVIVASFLVACGGGTTGTSGSTNGHVRGSIVVDGNLPLPDVAVTVLETGDFGVSGSDGTFSFEADFTGEDVHLLIEIAGLSEQVDVGRIPVDGHIFIQLSVKIEGQRIIVTVLDFAIALPQAG